MAKEVTTTVKKKKNKVITKVVTKETLTNEKTEIVCVLDGSGSMTSIINDMIGGFNTFLEDQKKLEDECTITIAIFSSRGQYKLLHDNVDIKTVKPLTKTDWYPNGMTALYDAIGTTITNVSLRHAKNESEKPNKVLVNIITDGEENNSIEYNLDAIKALTKEKEKADWVFVYLGANQDSFSVGNSMGFSGGNTMNYTASAGGSAFANSSLSKMSSKLRSVSTQDAFYSATVSNLAADILPEDIVISNPATFTVGGSNPTISVSGTNTQFYSNSDGNINITAANTTTDIDKK